MKIEDHLKMKKQIKINFLTIVLVLISVVFAGIITIYAETEQPKTTHAFTENIVLGGVFPIVKRPDAGRDRRDAFLMAVATLNEQANDSNPTGGSRILPDGINFTAIVKDDDNTAAGGTFAASTLISEGVDVVIGSSGSSVSAAMAAELGPEKIVQLSYASSSPTLSNRNLYPYFMRNTPSDADQGIAVADLADAFNWTKGATICTSDSYGTGLTAVFTNIFRERGGTITTAQQFEPTATDVSTQVAAIKASNPEFVLANMIDVDGATLFKEAADQLLTNGLADVLPWLITSGTSTTATFSGSQAVQDAMQNFIGTTPLAMKTAEYAAFNASWFDPKWQDPKYWKGLSGPIYSQATGLAFNSYAPLAYDAVYIAAKALRDAGTAEGDALLEAMYKVTHTGASGEIKFNALGELNGRFDYVHLSGTVYTSFGVWNGTGYGLDPATFTLPDTTTFVPIKLTFHQPNRIHALPTQIKIGGVFPITGRPEAGRDRRDGFLMAVYEINNQTGTNRVLPEGVNLVPNVQDDLNTPEGAQAAADALLAWEADIVCGTSGSSNSMIMATAFTPFKIPQISYASSSPALSNRTAYPYFMRVSSSEADEGIAIADLVQAFGWTKGAIIHTSDYWITSTIEVFTDIFEDRGGTILTDQQFDTGETDVVAQISAIKDTSPEFVFGHFNDMDAATTVKEAQDQDIVDMPWIFTSWWSYSSTFEGKPEVQKTMQNFIGTALLPWIGPQYTEFNQSWFSPEWNWLEGPSVSQTNEIMFNSFAPLAYDAVYVAAKGLAAAGTTDGDALLAALYDVTHEGAGRTIEFNELGEVYRQYDYVQLNDETFSSFGEWHFSTSLNPGTIILPDSSIWSIDNNKATCIANCPSEMTTTLTTTSCMKETTTTSEPQITITGPPPMIYGIIILVALTIVRFTRKRK